MRTVTNCFVLNLAAADLLFAFSIPAVAYTRIVAHWQFGDLACRLVPYIQVSNHSIYLINIINMQVIFDHRNLPIALDLDRILDISKGHAPHQKY